MKKNSKIFVTVLLGLFLFGCAFFAFSFIYSSIENISVQSFKSKLDEYNKKEKAFLELEETYKEWKSIADVYGQFKNDYMIKFNDYPAFRNELQSILGQNGIQLQKLSHKYRNILTDIRKVSVDMRVIGAYRNIKKVIFTLENKIEMILFKSIQLNRMDTNRIMGKISLEVYFVK